LATGNITAIANIAGGNISTGNAIAGGSILSSTTLSAVGNVIDRMLWGHVVDFLDFHWAWLSPVFYQGHFPAFNVADSAISVGVVCMIADELIRARRSKKA
jgi:signal peptidase II